MKGLRKFPSSEGLFSLWYSSQEYGRLAFMLNLFVSNNIEIIIIIIGLAIGIRLACITLSFPIKPSQGAQRRMVSVVNFFVFLKLLIFAFLLIYVTGVRFGCYAWPISAANSLWKSFLKHAISRASLILQKRFPDNVGS